MKDKRNNADKLRTLLFGKDLRITKGDVYSEVREYDFSSYYPEDKYISKQTAPTTAVFDIREYGADVSKADNAPYINRAVSAAAVRVCGRE